MKEAKVAPKPKIIKKKKTSKVEMVTYAMKMTIPTGEYANIVPEIVVKGGSIEEAHAFIAPHMNRLWKEYYLINERRAPDLKIIPNFVPAPAANVTTTMDIPVKTTVSEPVVEASPISSVALFKATNAIQSCLSVDALDIIARQVSGSVKLTQEDKEKLMPLIDAKYEELKKNNE